MNIIFTFPAVVKHIIRLDRSSPNAVGLINSQQSDSEAFRGPGPFPQDERG